MAKRKYSRLILTLAAVVFVGAALGFAFWPRPVFVDLGEVRIARMTETIDADGRTRVREAFVVSTPVDGRLLRVEVEPGDPVTRDATVVARMRPANPAVLDVRTREQALAALGAAEAALHVAQANLEEALANRELVASELERNERLAERGAISQAALDRARSAARSADARLATARAAIDQREAELKSAQAQLIGVDDRGLFEAMEGDISDEMPIRAPADGVILRVMHRNETTLAAGSPILEIGDVRNDLEVFIELTSKDAVQVTQGDPVIIENWGGSPALAGLVTRISPFAETRVTALGVEEQRVQVIVELSTPPERRPGLGHGYAVDTRIVVRAVEEAVVVPSSALFRDGDDWAVFVAADGRARLRTVEIVGDNGQIADLVSGLEVGEAVVLYPPADLADGDAIAQREVGG